MAISKRTAQTGKRVYRGTSLSPNRGQVSASGAQGYIQRELRNKAAAGVKRPIGNDGKSDSRSTVAAQALARRPIRDTKAMGGKPFQNGGRPVLPNKGTEGKPFQNGGRPVVRGTKATGGQPFQNGGRPVVTKNGTKGSGGGGFQNEGRPVVNGGGRSQPTQGGGGPGGGRPVVISPTGQIQQTPQPPVFSPSMNPGWTYTNAPRPPATQGGGGPGDGRPVVNQGRPQPYQGGGGPGGGRPVVPQGGRQPFQNGGRPVKGGKRGSRNEGRPVVNQGPQNPNHPKWDDPKWQKQEQERREEILSQSRNGGQWDPVAAAAEARAAGVWVEDGPDQWDIWDAMAWKNGSDPLYKTYLRYNGIDPKTNQRFGDKIHKLNWSEDDNIYSSGMDRPDSMTQGGFVGTPGGPFSPQQAAQTILARMGRGGNGGFGGANDGRPIVGGSGGGGGGVGPIKYDQYGNPITPGPNNGGPNWPLTGGSGGGPFSGGPGPGSSGGYGPGTPGNGGGQWGGGSSVPQVPISQDGILQLPYNQNFSAEQLNAINSANQELLGLKMEGDEQAQQYARDKRDTDLAYQALKTMTLNRNAAGGTAFSSQYGTGVANNANMYANQMGDIEAQNSGFLQDRLFQQSAIQSSLQQQLAALAQQYAHDLNDSAGDLGYGTAQQADGQYGPGNYGAPMPGQWSPGQNPMGGPKGGKGGKKGGKRNPQGPKNGPRKPGSNKKRFVRKRRAR